MKKMLLTTISVSMIVFSAQAADTYTDICENLGYKTDLTDCTVGLPLLCPVSNNSGSSKIKCLCMTESCRGYNLTEKDLDEHASDGRKVREHIKALDTCDSGIENDKVTYYRIKECNEDSLYQVQNDKPTCDIGCPRSKYPYTEHPGDLAGVVESCIDDKGVWFGYIKCNDGWVAGGEGGHECNFNECSLKNYPYTYNPNDVQYRGSIKDCKVGGNSYYQYTKCDSGFTAKGSVCQAECRLKNCYVIDTSKGFNEWACRAENKLNCQAGDAVYLGGSYVGVIGYQANDVGNSLIMATETNNGFKPFSAVTMMNNLARDSAVLSYNQDGRVNSLNDLRETARNSQYKFPAIEACHNYSSPLCSNSFCSSGEWFLGSYHDLKPTFENRYILFNVTSHAQFAGGTLLSSYGEGAEFSYSSGGATWSVYTGAGYTVPILVYKQE